MSVIYGFAQALETRSNGWVAVQVVEAHASNGVRTLVIPNVDGDLTVAHRKLAQVAMLRDAISHTLPVSIAYRSTKEEGDVIDDVEVYPLRSIAGRRTGSWISGVVIGLLVQERGPESSAAPYRDEADVASVTLLTDGGAIHTFIIDLQRALSDTGHAILAMCSESRRERTPIRLFVQPEGKERQGTSARFVMGSEWATIEARVLEEVNAFVEQIGQRTGSFDVAEPRTATHLWVRYTTAPDMVPDLDVSTNGTFNPETRTAFVRADSPLADSLHAANRGSHLVRLGLAADEIQSAEVYGPLASAARPIWVCVSMAPFEEAFDAACVSQPTIQSPAAGDLAAVPRSVAWSGEGYFNKGIWRFVLTSSVRAELEVDGEALCLRSAASTKGDVVAFDRAAGADVWIGHAYLDALHDVKVRLHGFTCRSSFGLAIYRLR